jgi:signal transduction histidine kinase
VELRKVLRAVANRDTITAGAAALVAGIVVGLIKQQTATHSLAFSGLSALALGVVGAARSASSRTETRAWLSLAMLGAAVYGLAILSMGSIRDDTTTERLMTLAVSGVVGVPVGIWVLFRKSGPGHRFLQQRLGLAQLRADMSSLRATHTALERRDREIRALHDRLLQADEATRRALAREIHDVPLQRLIHVMRLADQASQPALRTQIELAAGELRDVAEALRPRAIDDLGLTGALRWLADTARDRGPLKAVYSPTGDLPTMDQSVEVALFRIAQEAVSNTVRHADANRMEIRTRAAGGRVLLEVSDDGSGFEPKASHSGVGLIGISERARAIGARWGVRSRSGETRVWIVWRAKSHTDV